MGTPYLLHQLIAASAARTPDRIALTHGPQHLSYAALHAMVEGVARGLRALGLGRGERVALYVDKRHETVAAAFGATAAGGIFVPINPILKADQVRHILQDCAVRVLITTAERAATLGQTLSDCHDLRHLVVIDPRPPATASVEPGTPAGISVHAWDTLFDAPASQGPRGIDNDVAAILYTSGSTGRPKGVVLSHRNMVTGARSVADYLDNHADDTLLAALPLSFDAGFSQLTTAFHVGARVVLLNYLMPRDVLKALERERVTGLTAVPPLWIQLAQHDWPATIGEHLRYIANTGGRLPRDCLARLRHLLPTTRPYLMYGLTEAFRATYLPPDEIERRPDSIGKAIPNAEVLVLREDGSPCAANEPGELVQRGALVALGYWNDPARTAERFKPLPAGVAARDAGLVQDEIAVFSGDTVRMDEDGYLYFIGRRDEMIKTSGYRVSPTEVEEVVYATGMVGECAAFGIAHDTLGAAIGLIITAPPAQDAACDHGALLAECRKRMPAYMVPTVIRTRPAPLPRNPNGKIDRTRLARELATELATELAATPAAGSASHVAVEAP